MCIHAVSSAIMYTHDCNFFNPSNYAVQRHYNYTLLLFVSSYCNQNLIHGFMPYQDVKCILQPYRCYLYGLCNNLVFCLNSI
jgi:hypothetical protein